MWLAILDKHPSSLNHLNDCRKQLMSHEALRLWISQPKAYAVLPGRWAGYPKKVGNKVFSFWSWLLQASACVKHAAAVDFLQYQL